MLYSTSPAHLTPYYQYCILLVWGNKKLKINYVDVYHLSSATRTSLLLWQRLY